MSKGSGQQTTTQRTSLPPQFQQAAGFLLDEGQRLGRSGRSLTPGLSDPTRTGIDLLQQPPPGISQDVLMQTAMGQGPASTAGVESAVTQAAQRAVQDRFSQAGRSGSPAEGMAIGRTVARELAPFSFQGQARQLQAAQQLPQMQRQMAQDFLTAGGLLEEQERQQLLEPFQRFQLASGPITSAIGGAPMTQTTTQPVNRNVGAGVLGGAATGLGLGSLTAPSGATGLAALGGPVGIGLGIGGGLLGGIL